MLTPERAHELNDSMVTEEHLKLHALNVSYAMGAMAKHFGEDAAHWEAIGYLHDYDYEKYPEEHLQHTRELLLAAGALQLGGEEPGRHLQYEDEPHVRERRLPYLAWRTV